MHRSGLIMELAFLFLFSQGLQSCMVFHHYLKIVASDISPSFIVYWEIGIIYILSLMEASVDFAPVLERRNLKRLISLFTPLYLCKHALFIFSDFVPYPLSFYRSMVFQRDLTMELLLQHIIAINKFAVKYLEIREAFTLCWFLAFNSWIPQ